MKRIAYLDCFAGIAGDMFLGALVDAGVPRTVLQDAAAALNIGASLRFETVDRSGIRAIKVYVMEGSRLAGEAVESAAEQQAAAQPYTQHPQTQHQHMGGHGSTHPFDETLDPGLPTKSGEHGRTLSTIRQLIQDSTLDDAVKTMAVRAFELLGRSEAKIHNVGIEEVHFHEVGAVDAIVDIVASAAGAAYLQVDEWHCSPINVGGGTVRCAHGVFPVPAPATADLLRGVPTYSAHLMKELITPTGAALLRALAPSFGAQPAMQVQRIGYGAGTRNPAEFPNVVRLSVGEAHVAGVPSAAAAGETDSSDMPQPFATEAVSVLEAALDDATPQLLAFVAEQAMGLGALDVMLTPVTMKKGRPGTLLTLLAKPEDAPRFQDLLLRETTTLGVRVREDRRACLERRQVVVETRYGPIRIKIGFRGDSVLNAHPEFEDCRKAAEAQGVPLKQVHAAALAMYLREAEGPQL